MAFYPVRIILYLFFVCAYFLFRFDLTHICLTVCVVSGPYGSDSIPYTLYEAEGRTRCPNDSPALLQYVSVLGCFLAP
jgi:hypothetical protein